ncbi:MAG: transcriptional regulator, partial [Brumimicrobium sp.]
HYINYINNNKLYKTKETSDESNSSPPAQPSKNNPIKKKKKFIPPKLEETKAFFQEQKSTNQNAEMFQNHFDSNGWLVGGKTKMKDWKAAARNWILRSSNFNNSKKSNLHVNQDKDYDIPL